MRYPETRGGIIQSLDGYAKVSQSMTGAHVFVKGRIPGDVDGWEITEDLDVAGHVEIYGYPINGWVVGATWLHIEDILRYTVPEVQDVIDELVDEYVDKEDQLNDQEQADDVIERYQSQIQGSRSGRTRLKYYDLDPVPIANIEPFRTYERNGQSPHPVYGAPMSHDNLGPDDKDSMNFGVDSQNGWKCWAHDDGGGALQLIVVLEGIRAGGM